MTTAGERPLAAALRAVGVPGEDGGRLAVVGEPGAPSRLPVEELGVACVGAAILAAARLHEARTGERLSPSVDRDHLRAALVSERLFFVDGERAGAGFAPQSRFWRAGDGWVRTHANYPWHHAALLRGLAAARADGGCGDPEEPAAAIALLPAERVEEAVFAAGGVAAAVRTPEQWLAHPQGAAVAAEPLVGHVRLGDADPRPLRRRDLCGHGAHNPRRGEESAASRSPRRDLSGSGTDDPRRGEEPVAADVRVLDLTRVIAGPVCSRYLGALGADVLRVDPPNLPDVEPGTPADTLLGKRSAFLDLRTAEGACRLDVLLADADVVLLGYRPGSLARFGLAPGDLAARHPGLVIVELSAWGHSGPWAERRGFDSIVQAASGIASVEATPDGEPGALPCQLLDHGTGYLAAAATIAALAEQRETGGTLIRRLSLARTAHWLLAEAGQGAAGGGIGACPGDGSGSSPRAAPPWHERGVAFVSPVDGDPSLAAVPPSGSLGRAGLRWPRAARYGADAPDWAGSRVHRIDA